MSIITLAQYSTKIGSMSIEHYLIDHEIKGKICGAIYGKNGIVYVDDSRFLK